jgi:prolyl oligopeptidase
MSRRSAASLAALVAVTVPAAFSRADDSARLSYPPAPPGSVVTDYFGTKVPDPYRWMEDVDSPQTRAWVLAEQKLTDSYLAAVPGRAQIHEQLTRLWNYEKISVPVHSRRGDQYFVFRNTGLQNQNVLYVSTGAQGAQRVLIDPNGFSKDGTVALGPWAASDDGKLLAYSTQDAGSDWQTWHVRDVATGRDTGDRIEWSKFSGASWLIDGSGFFYTAYDVPKNGDALKAPAYYQKVMFHRLGTPQSADKLVYQRRDRKDWYYGTNVSEDGRYLVLTIASGSDPYTRIYYRDLHSSDPAFKPIFPKAGAIYSFVDNAGPRFYFQADLDAPRGRIIAVDIRHPQHVEQVVAESASALQSVSASGDRLFAIYLQDAHSVVKVYRGDGSLDREIVLPGIGSVDGFAGWHGDDATYYQFYGYTTPSTTYRYDIASGASTVVRRSKVAFDGTKFTTEQVFYRSQDGTRVPMFISYRKGLVRDGKAPTILYGYGGFDISITPFFSLEAAQWLNMGGIYAVANIRGGQEYGEAWHRAGMLANKQRVFDDFIAAAEYLIAQKYTSTSKLAAKGESNGGLLVGAMLTQRPDLFGAALPGVGVMDMLRFQKFTGGNAWVSEYGSSDDSAAQFKTLVAYSPLQNIKPGTVYPPTMVFTADHDDRVFPAHSFKFTAALQRAQAGPSPILLRVDTNAGHGGGKPTAKIIDEAADAYAFLTRALNMDYGSPEQPGTPAPQKPSPAAT